MAYDWTTIDAGKTYISNFDILGAEKYLKDSGARTAINDLNDKFASYTEFLGVTTTELIDGVTTSAVVAINGEDVTAVTGNIVIYNKTVGLATKAQEFIYDGTVWQLFGDLSGLESQLGDLAYANSASASYTPVGDVSVELSITPSQSISVSGTTTGSIAVSLSVSESQAIETTGTPKGAVTNMSWTGKEKSVSVSGTTTGSVQINAAGETKNYTPSGTINVTLDSTNGSFVTGLSNDGSLPTFDASLLTASISGETLTFTLVNNGFTQGAFPTVVTASALTAVSVSEKTFSGSSAAITFSGATTTFSGSYTPEVSTQSADFNGSTTTFEGTFTPDVEVTSAVFTGSDAIFTGTFTPAVSVSSATFAGSVSTISVSAPRS